jgi:hypothetical protein
VTNAQGACLRRQPRFKGDCAPRAAVTDAGT